MILLALWLLVVGCVTTIICGVRRSRQVWKAALGTAAALFAILAGLSIGFYFIPVSAMLLLASLFRIERRVPHA
jgi:hypothetical protein